MVRVLVADDSVVVRSLLRHILDSHPDIEVCGTARDGMEVLRRVEELKPDLVTMDIHMPKLDGYAATRRIMEKNAVPIVIVSATYDPGEVKQTFKAMEVGALAALEKPVGPSHPRHEELKNQLIRTVLLLSEVKVVTRRPRRKRRVPVAGQKMRQLAGVEVVAIGASTGGPPVLRTILSELPKGFGAPVLIVQHIALGFTRGLVDWLNLSSRLKVSLATENERIRPGHCYIAPDEVHLEVSGKGRLSLVPDAPENSYCPSVSRLFRSVAGAYGERAIGVLLTGMGRDGAQELKLLKDKGAMTIAQDKESSVVHGMAGAAVQLGGAELVLPGAEIAPTLGRFVGIAPPPSG